MAEETKQNQPVVSACEQYVVDELKQAKKEIAELKEEVQRLDFISKLVHSRYDDIVCLVKNALKGHSEIEETDYFYNLYIAGKYIGIVGKDTEQRNDKEKELAYLMELISLANDIVEREA